MKLTVVVHRIRLMGRICNYEVTHAAFLILGAYFTFISPAGVESLSCYNCLEREHANMCMDASTDVVESCPNSTLTCVIGTGLRRNKKLNRTELEPCMSVRCSLAEDAAGDALIWKRAQSRGDKMICELLTRSTMYGSVTGLVDRRCLCGQDKCNRRPWNEVMVQPLILPNHTATDIPVVLTLGENAVENLLKLTTPVVSTSTRVTEQAGQGTGQSQESTTRASTAEAGGGGLNAGLLAGLAVGGLLLVGLIGAGIYWFKFRKRKERDSDATGVSSNSAGSDVSGDDD